jgi:phosphotransferase system HPr (HPr) family protein
MTSEGPVRLTVRNPSGLHARPAALFVRTAGAFGARVRVANVTRDKPATDAKSILGVLALGVSRGHEIELTADGDDAAAALRALTELIETGLGEELPADEPAGETS